MFSVKELLHLKSKAETFWHSRIGVQPSEYAAKGSLTIQELSTINDLALAGYKVSQYFPTTAYANGLDGHVVILIDERLDGIPGRLEEPSPTSIALMLGHDDAVASFKDDPPLQALLLVVDNSCRVVYYEVLGRETARLDRAFLYSDKKRPTYIVTTDFSIGWGSYNGPISQFLEISEDGIYYVLSHGLMHSLKSAWVIGGTQPDSEIWYKTCRPNFNAEAWSDPSSQVGALDFEVTFKRIFFQDGKWQSSVRHEAGFWEVRENSTPAIDASEFQF